MLILIREHQPTVRLHHRVCRGSIGIRTIRAITTDRDIDEVRFERGKRLIAHAKTLGHTRTKILHDDIGLHRHIEQNLFSFLSTCIQRKGFFTGAMLNAIGAMSTFGDTDMPNPVTRGRFDLDDIGALLPQNMRAIRSCDALADV